VSGGEIEPVWRMLSSSFALPGPIRALDSKTMLTPPAPCRNMRRAAGVFEAHGGPGQPPAATALRFAPNSVCNRGTSLARRISDLGLGISPLADKKARSVAGLLPCRPRPRVSAGGWRQLRPQVAISIAISVGPSKNRLR
jgi:hypothetical protein